MSKNLRKQFEGQKGYHSIEEDVTVGDGMKQTFYTDAYVEWLEALAKAKAKTIDILRTTKKWDKEYADAMELVEKREVDKRDKTITAQAQELEKKDELILSLTEARKRDRHTRSLILNNLRDHQGKLAIIRHENNKLRKAMYDRVIKKYPRGTEHSTL